MSLYLRGLPGTGEMMTRFKIVGRRFRRADDGGVAIEFALTAIPFFTLIFAIFEAGAVFFATATLDDSVADAGRLIRTGQAQTSSMTQTQLITTICNKAVFLSNCANNLKIDVRSFSTFASVTFPSAKKANGDIDTTQLKFQTGSAGDIVLVRVFYNWTMFSPLPTGLNNNGTRRLIQSSIAFRNEPYTS